MKPRNKAIPQKENVSWNGLRMILLTSKMTMFKTRNGERGTGNGESLKAGIFKSEPVGSVGRAPDYRAGGESGNGESLKADRLAQLVEHRTTVREVAGSKHKPRPDQHSGSLNN